MEDKAQWIKEIRARGPWSMREFADLLSVTERSVWRWEHGEVEPRAENVRRLKEIERELEKLEPA